MSDARTQEFIASFESVAGKAHQVSITADAAGIVAGVLAETGATCVAMAQLPEDLAASIRAHCQEHGVELLEEPYDSATLPGALDRAQVGITGIEFAIAQTGTLVEVALNDATRLVSSLPRTHIGIVPAGEMVPTLLEAAPRMREVLDAHDRNVVLSFLSGPSRTGDIELILTLGVHGPEQAHAILLG